MFGYDLAPVFWAQRRCSMYLIGKGRLVSPTLVIKNTLDGIDKAALHMAQFLSLANLAKIALPPA